MNELPVRKNIRLKGYDYNQNGGYFITFCTKDKCEILGQIVGCGILDAPRMELSNHGINLCNAIDFMDRHNDAIAVDKYVIMSNHVHIIVIVSDASEVQRQGRCVRDAAPYGDGRCVRDAAPYNAIVPKFISSIKRYTNKLAGYQLWQPRFHDHIIRNEAEYQQIWKYIDDNPAKWDEDCYYNATPCQ